MRIDMWALGIGVLALAAMGAAPASATSADDLCAPSADPCTVSTPVTVTDGSTIDVGSRELRVTNGGALDVRSGTMTLIAATLTVQSGGFVRALTDTSTPGGTINVQAGTMTMAGTLDASGDPGGTINVTVTNAFTATGTINANALARDGLGGTIQIDAASASLSGSIATKGGFDSIGGDLGVETTGLLSVGGVLDASGGDGGSVELDAGTMSSGGNLTVTDTGVLRADATNAGGFGGSIDATARGDGSSTGLMTANGQWSAKGQTGTEDIGGGSGGCVDLTASGNITVDRASARFNADGGAPDGDGGEVDFTSDNGGVNLQGGASAGAAGPETNGGSVGVDAATDVTIGGSIAVNGGDGGGGDVTVSSSAGSVSVGRSAVIDGSSPATGQGGSISLESGFGSTGTHNLLVEGRLTVDGGPSGGSGGSIDLTGGDSLRIASTGAIRAAGSFGGGSGGTVNMTANPGTLSIDAPMVASGGGPNGQGGIIAFEATGKISLTAAIDASGFGPGGQVGFGTDTGPVDILADIDVHSSASTGGSIEVTGTGDVRVAGTLETDGTAVPGGKIDITGCDVTICGLDSPLCPAGASAVLSSSGPSGVNRITGRDSTGVFGMLKAAQSDGRNELVYDGDPDRAPIVLGQVTPPATIITDPSVLPCPVCGNHVIEPPETCDDGNTNPGDGCSATCQVEAPPSCAGDCNGNGAVVVNELVIGVNIALGQRPVTDCSSLDSDSSGSVAVNELVRAVLNALNGCG